MFKGQPLQGIPARLVSLLATALLMLPLMLFPLRQMIYLSQAVEIRRLDSGSGQLEKMVFTAEAFARLNFTRANREFSYQGNMYDVHSIVRSDTRVIVLAIWDKPESRMLQAFQSGYATDSPTLPEVSGLGFMPYFQVGAFRPVYQPGLMERAECQLVSLIYSDPCFLPAIRPPELRIAS